MPLHAISEAELREHCRRALDGLERWLRRLVDENLTAAYGPNYLSACRPSGDRVINADTTRRIIQRAAVEPVKFPRAIDAADLDDTIRIICNPELYVAHFTNALSDAFPEGCVEAKTFLLRLVPPRNALSHARPISIHEAHRVLCYSQDVVAALKVHYGKNQMQKQYNVPTVIRIVDSLGHEISLSDSNRHRDGPAMIDFSQNELAVLRCGDSISIEVDIDPSFEPDAYEVRWLIANVGGAATFGRRFSLHLTQQHVATRFCVVCYVTSKAEWHKIGTFDDQVDIAYRVLPPI